MSNRRSFDRPHGDDATPDTPEHFAELWVLAQRLQGQRLEIELSDQTLVVHGPEDDEPLASITVLCRARTDDGNRPWFFTSSGEPITEADRIIDAALIIRSLLDRGRS